MRTKKLVALTAGGGLVLTPLGLMPAPSAVAAPGTGSFFVSAEDWVTGQGLPGLQVTLYDAATGATVGSVATTSTDDPGTPWDEGGQAVFRDLDSGSYTAKVHDPTGKHVDKFTRVRPIDTEDYYSSASDFVALVPTTVEVGILSGTITQSTDGNGDLEALVEVFPAGATEASIASGAVRPLVTDHVYAYDYDDNDEDGLHSGDWSVKVPGGQSYKVRVSDTDTDRTCHSGEDYSYVCEYDTRVWVGGVGATAASATSFPVSSSGKVSAGTKQLPVAPVSSDDRITGTVTGAGGTALDDVEVELFKQLPGEGGAPTWKEVASTETGDDGTFGFDEAGQYVWDEEDYYYDGEYHGGWDYAGEGPLTAGTYTLRYTDGTGYAEEQLEYVTTFLGKVAPDPSMPAQVPATASTITLADSGTATGDLTMTRRTVANTSGTYGVLTDDTGNPHRGWISFVDQSGNQVWSTSTRRDGTFSAPTSSLPPGQYRMYAESSDRGALSGWVGGKTFRQARVITIGITGVSNAGGTALLRPATLAGTISAAALPGTDDTARWVTLLGPNGHLLDELPTAADGTFSVRVAPGTYYLAADGVSYSSFDSSDVGISEVDLVEQFWRGSYSLAGATPLVVGSGGQVTGLDMTLSNKLVATAAPAISGTARSGGTLTTTVGSWNVSDDLTFAVAWLRGGSVVGTGTSYAVSPGDAGQALTVQVTATDATGTYQTGTSTSTVGIEQAAPPAKPTKPTKPNKPNKGGKGKGKGKGKGGKGKGKGKGGKGKGGKGKK